METTASTSQPEVAKAPPTACRLGHARLHNREQSCPVSGSWQALYPVIPKTSRVQPVPASDCKVKLRAARKAVVAIHSDRCAWDIDVQLQLRRGSTGVAV